MKVMMTQMRIVQYLVGCGGGRVKVDHLIQTSGISGLPQCKGMCTLSHVLHPSIHYFHNGIGLEDTLHPLPSVPCPPLPCFHAKHPL